MYKPALIVQGSQYDQIPWQNWHQFHKIFGIFGSFRQPKVRDPTSHPVPLPPILLSVTKKLRSGGELQEFASRPLNRGLG